MMCEECGIRPAKFHLMTITNDERIERNLCPVCMAKYQKQLPGITGQLFSLYFFTRSSPRFARRRPISVPFQIRT